MSDPGPCGGTFCFGADPVDPVSDLVCKIYLCKFGSKQADWNQICMDITNGHDKEM